MHVKLLVAALVAIALLAAIYLLSGDRTADETSEAVRGDPGSAQDGPVAVLRGRSASSGPREPLPWLDDLRDRARSADGADRHAALRVIKKRAAEIPLETLLDWALTPQPEGGSDALAALARNLLGEREPESMALLPEILRAGLGASEGVQEAVAQTLRALEGLDATHVPHVLALFEDDATTYWLKRTLVGEVGDLGEALLPLAPHLVDFGVQVLKERAESMRQAMAAGIHVQWDHVEYDVQRLLAAMGPDVVRLLAARLEALAQAKCEVANADTLSIFDPLGFVAGALGDSGLEGRRALARLLGHDDEEVRYEAAWALAHCDADLEPGFFLDPLQAALSDSDSRVRRSATEALGRCGEAGVPHLLAALADQDADVRKAAADALARHGVEAKHALPPLVAMLGGDDDFAALSAARTLGTCGAHAVPALDALLRRVRTEDVWFRHRFATAAALVAVHQPGTLTAAWASGDALMRVALLRVIKESESPSPAWNPLLDRALEDPDLRVRAHAAALLAAAGRRDVLPALIAGMQSEDGATRTAATAALAAFGEAAVHLLPDLLERLGNEERLWTPSGAGVYDQGEETALDIAIRAIGRYDLPRMYELLTNEDFNRRYVAITAFQAAGMEGLTYFDRAWETATPALRQELLDVAQFAFTGKGSHEMIQAVRKLADRGLSDPSARVRLQAVETLRRVPEAVDRCLDVLVELLGETDIHTVRMAAYRISTRSAHAARLEPLLREHAAHPDDETRGYIRTTLEAIEDAR